MTQWVKNPHAMQEIWVQSVSWEDPWRRVWQPTLVLLPGESHEQRSLVRYTVHGVAKSWTRLSNFTICLWLALEFFTAEAKNPYSAAVTQTHMRPGT